MSIYRPVNMQPNNSVIDATLATSFSCTVRGNNIKYYKFYIYLITNGQQIYSTTGTYSSTLFDGDIFSITIPIGTMINSNNYKWVVYFSSDNTTFVQSNESGFYAQKTPTLVINSFLSNMSANKYNFSAIYFQQQYTELDWYQWTLYDAFDNVLKQSPKTYGVNPNYIFSGFISGYSYQVQVVGENKLGVSVLSEKVPFTAQFNVSNVLISAVANANCNRDSVEITFPVFRQINGAVNGSSTYENYNLLNGYKSSINIPSNSSIIYNKNIEINNNFSEIISTRIFNDGNIIQSTNQTNDNYINLSYFIGRLYFEYNGSIIERFNILQYTRALLFCVQPNELYSKQFNLNISCGNSLNDEESRYTFNAGNSTNTNDYNFFVDGGEKQAILLTGYGATSFGSANLINGGNSGDFENSELLQSGGINVYYMNV